MGQTTKAMKPGTVYTNNLFSFSSNSLQRQWVRQPRLYSHVQFTQITYLVLAPTAYKDNGSDNQGYIAMYSLHK